MVDGQGKKRRVCVRACFPLLSQKKKKRKGEIFFLLGVLWSRERENTREVTMEGVAREAPQKRRKRDFNHDHACGLCNAQSFSRRDKLIDHWRNKHREAMEAMVCPFTACGFTRDDDDGGDPNALAIHCWHVHGITGAKIYRCPHRGSSDDCDDGEKCASLMFGSQSELWEHEWIVHKKSECALFETSTGTLVKTVPASEKGPRDSMASDGVYKIIGKTKQGYGHNSKQHGHAFTVDLVDDLGALFGDLAARPPFFSSDEGD